MKICISIRRFKMQPVVALLAPWAFLQLASAEIGTTVSVQAGKRRFNAKGCLNVVSKVQTSGRYTEESIAPICNEEMEAGSCDFFSEALALAISHRDFNRTVFCHNMDRAQFCSKIMDKLLQSRAVSDLAFGECERAKPKKGIEYCRRIQEMLAFSVKQEDLDTMRACYMIEAFRKHTASKASPKTNITIGSEKDLSKVGKGQSPVGPTDSFGKGKGNISSPKIVQAPIVVRPVPFEQFGKGNGNLSSPRPPGIITEPIPVDAAPTGRNTTPKPSGILTEPVPVDAAATTRNTTSPRPILSGPVLAGPIPAVVAPTKLQKEPVASPPTEIIFRVSMPYEPRQVQKTLFAAPTQMGKAAAPMKGDTSSSKPILSEPIPASVAPTKLQREPVAPSPTEPIVASPVLFEPFQVQTTLLAAPSQMGKVAVLLRKGAVLEHSAQQRAVETKSTPLPPAKAITQPTPTNAAMSMKAPIAPHAPLPKIASTLQPHVAPTGIAPRHKAGLVQHQTAPAKAIVKDEGKDKKADYSGFLSKFVD